MTAVSPRLAPLLAQLDTSLDLAVQRMKGLTDEEFWWSPASGASTVAPDDQGRLRPLDGANDTPRTRTIVLLTGHLGEMAFLRADYTAGKHRLRREEIDWPGDAAGGLAFLTEGWACWRAAVQGLPDEELDIVGRCDFPWGLDPDLPILDIVWWMNRELIHHAAEVAFVRDLYASGVVT